MKSFKTILAAFAFLGVLVSCGGAEDSFTATLTSGNVTHVCQSESAANSCRNGNCSQCQCTAGCSSSSPTGGSVITQACVVNNNASIVPSAGCVDTAPRTWVCTSSTELQMVSGTGYTRADVLAQGASFRKNDGSNASVTFNGVTYSCL